MSASSRIASGLPRVGYLVLPLISDQIVKLACLVAKKLLPKSDPFNMRKYELGISTLLGAALIWRLPVSRIPTALIYTVCKAWDVWKFFIGELQDRDQTITQFFNAMNMGDKDRIAKFWENQPYLFKSTNDEGKNVLHVAAETNQLQMIKWLEGHELFSELNVSSRTGWKPVHLAVQKGHLLCVQYFHKKNNPAALDETIPGGGGVFSVAVKEDRLEIVKWLLQINFLQKTGGSYKNLFEAALQVCDKGTTVIEWIFNLLQQDEQGNALASAIQSALSNNNTKLAVWVKSKDPGIGTFLAKSGQNYILAAAEQGHKDILSWTYQVSPTAITNEGSRLMYAAVKHGKQDVAEWLYQINSQFVAGLDNKILKEAHPTTTQWINAKFLGRHS